MKGCKKVGKNIKVDEMKTTLAHKLRQNLDKMIIQK